MFNLRTGLQAAKTVGCPTIIGETAGQHCLEFNLTCDILKIEGVSGIKP